MWCHFSPMGSDVVISRTASDSFSSTSDSMNACFMVHACRIWRDLLNKNPARVIYCTCSFCGPDTVYGTRAISQVDWLLCMPYRVYGTCYYQTSDFDSHGAYLWAPRTSSNTTSTFILLIWLLNDCKPDAVIIWRCFRAHICYVPISLCLSVNQRCMTGLLLPSCIYTTMFKLFLTLISWLVCHMLLKGVVACWQKFLNGLE